MTTATFLACWIVLFIAGMLINAKDLSGKGGGVPGNTILMIVVSCLATFFVWALSMLGSA